MSEQAQPLSRRERREMEEAARMAEGDETQALPIAPETESVVSRRERRRMERLAHPVETWTAEEEMIATGQMPAMTNEVLAEQERLANERAEQAEAVVPDAVVEPVEVVAEPVAEPVAVAEPVEVVAEPVAEPVAEATPEADSMSHIPADLRHLFPPGSLQAQALAAKNAAAQNAAAHNTVAEGAAEPNVDAPAEQGVPTAADEIRRLSQEAMAGLSRAASDANLVAAGTEFEPVEFVASDADANADANANRDENPDAAEIEVSVPALPDGVDVEALWNAPTVEEPVRAPLFPAAEADAEPVALTEAPAVADVPAVTEPHQGEPDRPTPVWSALVPATPTPATQPVAQRTAQQAAQPTADAAPSMWDTHPLTNPAGSPVRELPAKPVKRELPRPDLTALLATQAGPGVVQPPLTSTEATTATSAVLRPSPEPHPGGGARHFRWVHLAVIGAIAFVLGVLAWNIARSGS